jgi:hypothetical protein
MDTASKALVYLKALVLLLLPICSFFSFTVPQQLLDAPDEKVDRVALLREPLFNPFEVAIAGTVADPRRNPPWEQILPRSNDLKKISMNPYHQQLMSQALQSGLRMNDVCIVFPPGWNYSSDCMTRLIEPYYLRSMVRNSYEKFFVIQHKNLHPRLDVESCQSDGDLILRARDVIRNGFSLVQNFHFLNFDTISARLMEMLDKREKTIMKQSKFKRRPGIVWIIRWSFDEVQTILQHPMVRCVIDSYIGRDVTIPRMTLMRWNHNKKVTFNALNWHHDWYWHRMKLYIYLNDVDEHTHPTQVYPSTHMNAYYFWRPREATFFNSTRIEELYGQEAMVNMTAPKGGGFFFDTNMLHRALRYGTKQRNVLVIDFLQQDATKYLMEEYPDEVIFEQGEKAAERVPNDFNQRWGDKFLTKS